MNPKDLFDPKNYAITVTQHVDQPLTVGSYTADGDLVLSCQYTTSGQFLVTTGAHFIFPETMGGVQ